MGDLTRLFGNGRSGLAGATQKLSLGSFGNTFQQVTDLGTGGQAEADPLGCCVVVEGICVTSDERWYVPDQPQELRTTTVCGVPQEGPQIANPHAARSLPGNALKFIHHTHHTGWGEGGDNKGKNKRKKFRENGPKTRGGLFGTTLHPRRQSLHHF